MKTTKVWIGFEHIDWEGSEFLGVYKDEQTCKKYIQDELYPQVTLKWKQQGSSQIHYLSGTVEIEIYETEVR